MNIRETKKRIMVLVLALSMVLSGCGTASASDFTKSVPEEVKTDSASELEISEDVDDETENWESLDESDDIASESDEDDSAAVENESDEETESGEESFAAETESEEEASDTEAESVNAMRKRIREIKENVNHDPIDLTPSVGEFCVKDETGLDIVSTPDGKLYGFWDDITEGCSVWCAVQDYKVEVEASSELAPQGSHSYEAENAINGYRESGWVEGVKGNGIGETISITKSYDVDAGRMIPDEESIFFIELCIVNGLARNDKTFRENGRVKSLEFYYNGEDMGTIELEDTIRPQYISLSGLNLGAKNLESVNFTFEIKDVYPGEKYEDTAITGIEIAFDTPNH